MVLLGAAPSFADDVIPPCLAYGRDLPNNTQQVLHWKRTTSNQFQERGHVTGVITEIYPDKNGHEHFQITMGKRPGDTLEIIYNKDFGQIPSIQFGMQVEACGDYITSTAQSGPYPASPDGAILHWIHMNPRGKGHDAGYLVLDGKLYGQEADNAGPKKYPPRPPKRGGGRRHFELFAQE
ncbi:MAG: hypothetical protein A2Z97_01465 [Bdellovibrionales bacterium GWB1_52_6]|nr:MAG: hypothetical protein A2Z97_01465 [Bdellovibrionales bacterium GWB1_52_6]